MRILLVIDWNRGRGGAEAHATLLRDALRARGEEVRLLTSSAGTAGDGTAEYVAYGTGSRAQQAVLQVVNPFAAYTVRRAVKEFRPDVAWVNMFAHHLSPAAVLALGDVPKVLLVSDYKIVCPLGSKLLPGGSLCQVRAGWVCHQSGCLTLPHWLRDQPRYVLIRAAVGRFDRVLACSRWVQQRLAEDQIQAEVLELPSPAPPADFTRRPAADPTFVFTGRLEVEKGVPLLLRAFRRLRTEYPSAVLRIAGEGPLRQASEDSIRFLGWLPPAQIESELASAWASVAPSLWAEPQGLVVAEAMLRGVPVIASSAGGPGEMVQHGVNGLLFENNDEDGLLNCLRAVASRAVFPDHRTTAPAERFSVPDHVEAMRRIFSEVAGVH